MAKKRVFISFDYDHDLDIKNSLVGQSKLSDSPFDISDMSITEAVEQNWKENARKRIKSSDLVIVMCGKHTDTAKGVAAELSITQEERKPYFLLAGHGSESKKPVNAYSDDKIYNWTWDNLKLLIDGKR